LYILVHYFVICQNIFNIELKKIYPENISFNPVPVLSPFAIYKRPERLHIKELTLILKEVINNQL
jgi:hypothetical protein